jgi:endonuclease V-like protein UPF0215 family
MKSRVMIVAFDDGPQSHPITPLVGVTCKGLQLLHVSYNFITVDGIDATEKLAAQLKANPYLTEVRLIMINSPTLGGFNPPNPFEIFESFQIPLVLIPESKPTSAIHAVYAQVFPDRLHQIDFLRKLPKLEQITLQQKQAPHKEHSLFLHCIGISKTDLIPVLQFLCEYSSIPEPLRLAHIIASSIHYSHTNDSIK